MAFMWCYVASDLVTKSKVNGMNLSFVGTLSNRNGVSTAFKIEIQSWRDSSVGKVFGTQAQGPEFRFSTLK